MSVPLFLHAVIKEGGNDCFGSGTGYGLRGGTPGIFPGEPPLDGPTQDKGNTHHGAMMSGQSLTLAEA